MKVPNTKIEAAACNEESRYALRAVLYDVAKKALVATDGHILAFIPHEPEKGDKTCLVPLRALECLRTIGAAKVGVDGEEITIESLKEGHQQSHKFTAEKGNFPKYESLLPKKDAAYKASISIDIGLLTRLHDALRPIDDTQLGKFATIELYVNGGDEVVVVKNPGNPGAIGLIMPVRL